MPISVKLVRVNIGDGRVFIFDRDGGVSACTLDVRTGEVTGNFEYTLEQLREAAMRAAILILDTTK